MRPVLLLLCLALLLPLTAEAKTPDKFDPCRTDARAHYTPIAKTLASTKALLFRLERCNTKPNYVFGTMHSDDPLVHNRAEPVIRLMPNLRIAAFEYVSDSQSTSIMQRTMFDPVAAKTLDSYLTAEEWQILGREMVVDRGMPVENLKRLRPWAAAVMVQMPKLQHGGQILDERLKSVARSRRIEVMGLETLEEQLSIFGGMPLEQQVVMLKDTLVNMWQLDQMNQDLASAYQMSDLQKIHRLGEQGFADIQDYDLRIYLKNQLLTYRNQHMAERAEPELAKGGMLIAVGALHLTGQGGVLERLEQAGYFIFPMQ